MFARAVINHGGIPFEVRVKQSSSQTLQAMQELEQGKGHKAKDASQLFEDLAIGKLDNA